MELLGSSSAEGCRFVVIGGFVADCIARTNSLPSWETDVLLKEPIVLTPGGKALNQAIALARLGATVTAVGAVGNDPAGSLILETLDRNGVSTANIRQETDASTPICIGFVSDSGQTSFVWRISDDLAVSTSDVEKARTELFSADAVLLNF